MTNPLLKKHALPRFKEIRVSDIEPTVDAILKKNRAALKIILNHKGNFTWQNLMAPIEDLDDCLHQMWSPIRHLNAVANSTALRTTYNKCLPKLTAYSTELSHNVTYYKAIQKLAKNKALNNQQKKVLKDMLHDFKLSGITLNETDKQHFASLQKQHAELTSKFEENVLDATNHWFYHTANKQKLKGLPQHTIQTAKLTASQKKLKGWVFTLDFPVYHAVMSYADSQPFRKKMYEAFSTRASDKGPNARKFNNSKIMNELLALRHEMAQMVGFKTFAEYSLATKMAKSPKQVFEFLNGLFKRVKPFGKKDFRLLLKFAKDNYGINKLNSWDIAFYSEKLRKKKYDITQEQLRAYFTEDIVISGMFDLVQTLFSINIKERKNNNTWHKDVRFFEIYDSHKKLIGVFYTDLYARPNKRGGAWMDECRNRRQLSNGKIQLPAAYLTCNFSKPTKAKPSLLTHDEVLTLFHEFGHCLQHLLTKINYPEISGINGVEWDAVELPSQFMENFCWEKSGLDLISCHHKTKEKLSDALFNKLIASKNFHSGLQMLRQLEFSLFDFRIHDEYSPRKTRFIQKTLDNVRKKVSVIPIPTFNRFQHSFAHIFGGGYAAGYYSYKWAEVLSSDAFDKFETTGIFNKKTGRAFLKDILEKGASEPALKLFIKFRGRKPKIDALLRHSGMN